MKGTKAQKDSELVNPEEHRFGSAEALKRMVNKTLTTALATVMSNIMMERRVSRNSKCPKPEDLFMPKKFRDSLNTLQKNNFLEGGKNEKSPIFI